MVLQSAAVAAICRYSPHAKGHRPNNSTGGPCRKEATRTPDPYVPNVVRYQLRYFPKHSRGAIPPSAGKSTQLFSSRRTISRFFFRQPPKTPLLPALHHPGRSPWPLLAPAAYASSVCPRHRPSFPPLLSTMGPVVPLVCTHVPPYLPPTYFMTGPPFPFAPRPSPRQKSPENPLFAILYCNFRP